MLEHRPCHKKMENRAVVIGSDSLCFDMSGCRLCQGRWTGSNQSYDVCKITVFQPPRLSSLLLNLICSPLFSRLQGSAIFLSQDYLSSMLSMTLTTVDILLQHSESDRMALDDPKNAETTASSLYSTSGTNCWASQGCHDPLPFHQSPLLRFTILWALPIYSKTKQVS